MLTGLDHLVIAVPDLDAAMRSYGELGFTVVRGGRHPVATHNALIGFADGAYLELLAFYEPSPDHRWWRPLQEGGGLVDFCWQTSDLAADAAALRGAGVEIADPKPLSRLRPDGYKLSWVLSIPHSRHRGVVPFLIQDETPREERVPRETWHPNGVTGIAAVAVAVEEVAAARRWYAEALGQAGEGIESPQLDAAGVRFSIGPHAIELLAPRGRRGPLRDWLRTRGPSPCAATLRTSSGQTGLLDETNSLGARLVLV